MWFMNPACLINKICRSHSKKSSEQTELLLHEDVEISSKKICRSHSKKSSEQTKQLLHEDVEISSKKKKHRSPPKGCKVLFVGAEEKKYTVPIKDLLHPKLQELLQKYQGPVFDPKWNDPIVLDQCSIEDFDRLRNNIKNSN